ncbi:uncharacterized protein LACBIDRAFT_329480 [Laccaria bicolor S238N-H82]|uniref:Predicted protein n=1 Tax=Laccaria bicolor (strain S238N-H82 / ATCC MYA-4686) TaxID=486041 RepID=B0DI53_LACBS|nr:uncharacterized protein LACBIDRAFT_329480 [Laccaria bicolor S238N-H82]EDR05515.1 predicted protein [Laccaria bicolor S238N-H82]|eukprot:XP_001883619.1 predicted protein [Laccaria bicolor S238N-H82]
MFEPAILHDYGKDEEISLSKEEAPPIVCDRSFTVYDIDGNPHEFMPEFHHGVFNDRFQEFMDLVYDGYIEGHPPHIVDPQKSCLAKLHHQDFSTMSASDIQNKMCHKQVVVTGLPFNEKMQFDAKGLRTLVGSMTAQISITDFSVINPGTDCVPSVVSGYVNDLLENASSTGKILNGLDLPMWSSYHPSNNYETDAVAWNVTRGTHRIPLHGPFPTQDREWGIAGLKHVLTFLHIDCDGPQDLKKLSSIDFYMDEDGFSLSGKPKDIKYDFEAVVLWPGDELHMLPNSAHWVYGIDDVVAQGGHYYSSYLMQETLQGIVHAFVLNKFLTNTEHIPSRHLLRRILIFYQVGLIEGGISEDDPASVHLPNVETMEGMLNIICLAVLIILGNVLDFRTYSTPNQGEDDEASPTQRTLMDTGDINAIPNNERIAYCYARGVALHILKWLRSCATFTGPPDGLADDLISLFFVQILASLSDYKSLAEAKSYGGVPHCTSHLLSKQIANILEVDPILKAAWAYKERVPSCSLALEEKEKYNVEWQCEWEPTLGEPHLW